MKIEFTLNIGGREKRVEIIEFDDDLIDGMTPQQVANFLEDEWKHWSANYIDGSARIVEMIQLPNCAWSWATCRGT